MPEQSNFFQPCVPSEDESDDGIAESKLDFSVSTGSGTRTSIATLGTKNSITSVTQTDMRRLTTKMASYVEHRGIPIIQTGCHSATSAVDDAVESAINLLIPMGECGSIVDTRPMTVKPRLKDNETIEVDYNGSLHTIVSSPTKSGQYDEVILIRKQENSKEKPKRFRLGRLFRSKKPNEAAKAPQSPPPSALNQRSTRYVKTSPSKQPNMAISLLDGGNGGESQRVQFAESQAREQPPSAPPPPRQRSRALKNVNAVHAPKDSTKNPKKVSWWGKQKNVEDSFETRRYVHEEEAAIQDGDTNVLMIRMHRTPTACMEPR